MAQRSLGAALLTLGCAALLGGCVMPDQLSELQKDVADVQQQLNGIEQDQAQARKKLEELDTKLGGEEIGREEFADLQVQLNDVARNVAILDERVHESNRRMDRLSENVAEIRQLARRQAAMTPPAMVGVQGVGGEGELASGTPETAADPVPSPEALYNAAYADFSKGNYALAISGFEEYASRFADSDLADNALYWVGECHFSQGRFPQAVEAFDRVLERYPKSDRAAAADLKKGLAYLEQNQVGKAIVQLRYVLSTYPSTDESRIARDKLTSLGASPGDAAGRP